MIESRVARLEQAISRVEEQLILLSGEFSTLKERVETVLAKVDDHHAQLYGELGKPGLVAQAGTLEELHVALKGYGREPGLIADIKGLSTRMSEWEESRKWLTRLIIGAIISDIVIHFIQVP